MANESMKTLRARVEEELAAGVANKERLLAAVPAMMALQSAVNVADMNLKDTKAVLEKLAEACSDYAHEHPEYVFTDTFSVSPIGVQSGDLTIDGRTYHFSYGFDGYRRDDPSQKLTQDFLKTLPKGWTKSETKIDTSAINKLKPSNEELAAAGLQRKPKPQWGMM